MRATLPLLEVTDFPPLTRTRAEILQVNLGGLCNQQCVHCHVDAGPRRTDVMPRETVDLVLALLATGRFATLDLTGGAPELNPHFRHLVSSARALDLRVIDRCNLTILEEPGQETLATFLAENRVEICASLPCYLEDNVNRQRGAGVFAKSLKALVRLNGLGYGSTDSGLVLNLVFNPAGATLPPAQSVLEDAYRRELGARYGIRFNRLLTLANMPIKRFGSRLVSTGGFRPYMALLKSAHRPENLDGVMCRTLLSVDWRGNLYDCDFNQQLGIPLGGGLGARRMHLSDLPSTDVGGRPIAVADHCYGCTAGQGSSCGGAL